MAQQLLDDLKICLNQDINDKNVISDIRNIIKLLVKQTRQAYSQKDFYLIDDITKTVIQTISIMKERIILVIGYIVGIFYHARNYKEVIDCVSSYFNKIDYNLFINERDRGIFGYYYGLLSVKIGNYKGAAEALEKAYLVANDKFKKQILMYLVPLKLRCGMYLPMEEMKKYGNKILIDLSNAVNRGDVSLYEKVINKYDLEFVQIGILELVETLRLIVYRNLLEIIFTTKKTTKLHLQVIIDTLISLGVTEISLVDIANILTNMALNGILIGAVYIGMKAIAASPTNPLRFYQY
ncbi:hypothetical protein KM1_008070 [Entamoeba histolytica HM-3:IMSS]|uniref:Uncharacterized protein n=6 Tax=Entamoeba histolytica TaxID=5759 RepID=C4M0Y4_ENTH1|nr:hypothetical protein, conserved [Entamoeba histolytica HM-1:IMSS]EMD48595.1 Hypothetical protein EHI5A_009500 [Entamoeba histolytica KU27]EMS14487.1 hypothetical protein KM1_008070 [Entamoeba histolytica HM-3:IMSS]ENY60594.1 hypothetical protein EHI7A_048040 [Entamoeba histolytica HM-1:IMSS-A]GAT94841.1 hypothetical protein conserved [Entamoeba histolytica]EAL46282.2 hypothetical protein, conserved [Entamoeba histolytica HM-1:IMSS]|eukprot:XP_651669.2 hypothetical protein, conserved [Entamoeba histolytica HM-1:IMSS]